MDRVIELFEKIKNTSGSNDKKNIVAANKDNELFKKCLVFLLDGNVITSISEKKINKDIWLNDYLLKLDTFEDVIDYLKENNTGTDKNVLTVQMFINSQPEEHREFYKEMVTKKYRLGVDAKTVNKVIPGLIPTFDVMLGTPLEKAKLNGNEKIFISRKLNGCFDGNTYITMGDGSKKKIKDIVVGDEVLSFDENTNEISKQKVTNVFDNGLKEKEEWLQIETGIERGNLRDYILVTKNHKIFTPNGWKRADGLNNGDSIYLRDYELSETQKSVLLGIGLGDASVIIDNPNIRTVRFNYPKKIDGYLKYLHDVCDLFDVYTGTYDRRTSGYGAKIERCSIRTIYNIPSYFTNHNNLLRMSYTFTDEILRNLTPLALATYYIDDGSKLPCKDDGNLYATNKHPRVTLATHRHNKEDVERFSRYLYERYLITNRVARYETCYENAGYQIELDVEGTYRFFDLIAKYIPYEIREQKLSKYWHNVPYEDWTKDFGEYKLVEKKVENIIESKNIKFGSIASRKTNRAYDIEVANNHTYFANGYAVHNCRAAFIGNKMMTRQGKEYNGLNHIIVDLQKLVGTDTFVDGELVYKNKEGLSDSAAFQLGTGLAMSKSDDKSDLKLVIFDIFPLKEFWSGKSKETYSERYNRLNELRNEIVLYGLEENIEVVEMFYDGYDHSEIWKWLDYAENMDYEGCILNLDACYECKRSKNLIKVKKFKEIDLRCTSVNIATSGKYKGILGSVTCKYEDGFVDVGSGFDDADRKYYTDHPEEIVGKVLSIKYKEETENKNGGKSLQFPVFICKRNDSDKSFADDEV